MKKRPLSPMVLLIAAFSFFACESNTEAPIAEASTEVGTAPEDTTTNDWLSKILGPIPTEISYLTGQFEPATHPDFTAIDPAHTNKTGIYLRKDTYEAFKRMHRDAARDGIVLTIVSATRNFEAQKRIWEDKWTGKRQVDGEYLSAEVADAEARARKILRYSSMPGSSRHHWGTDIDLNALTNSFFAAGEGLTIYNWLINNAYKYGFCQPYTAKGSDRPNGYEEEKWHWSFLPIAKPLTDLARDSMRNEQITGFLGHETAVRIGIRENYILGINPNCL
ncbi:MAG: M15 family metallopeptidase [Saprospiraceae bacterium]|nr:M15 family metallopeptidase [Saprospiraceae bacterium]MDP4999596.1 M15 family metallopeptidase [Saprospiraceae bacterium]